MGFFSPSQARDALHFSEDEDILIVRSLDFVSDYIDDCPWLQVSKETPKGVRSQPHGSNNKDAVCQSCNKYIDLLSHVQLWFLQNVESLMKDAFVFVLCS